MLLCLAVRELLEFYKFPGEGTPIIRGSALAAIEVREEEGEAGSSTGWHLHTGLA